MLISGPGLMVAEPVPHEPEHASVDNLLVRHTRSYDHFERVARELVDSGRLDETFVDHNAFRQGYGATILHVTLHNAQHRGEVLHILRRVVKIELPEGDPQEWESITRRP
jgi:uncharacterized damage-inducible protein DinB